MALMLKLLRPAFLCFAGRIFGKGFPCFQSTVDELRC
jgi:hypothetical protein